MIKNMSFLLANGYRGWQYLVVGISKDMVSRMQGGRQWGGGWMLKLLGATIRFAHETIRIGTIGNYLLGM